MRDATADAASDERRSPDRGIALGRGRVRTATAPVAMGRPPVDQGTAATPTDWSSARIRDNQDAELLAAQMQQALLDATPHGGAVRGVGIGGAGGGGAAGIGGGDAEGGRARPWASGPGDMDSRDPSDARYRRWLLDLRGKIGRAIRFPDERRRALDQGTSVYRVVLRRDGTVEIGPRLLRSSGFSDLDAAARAAIDASLPLPPIPEDVATGMNEIAVTLPIQFINPMFR